MEFDCETHTAYLRLPFFWGSLTRFIQSILLVVNPKQRSSNPRRVGLPSLPPPPPIFEEIQEKLEFGSGWRNNVQDNNNKVPGNDDGCKPGSSSGPLSFPDESTELLTGTLYQVHTLCLLLRLNSASTACPVCLWITTAHSPHSMMSINGCCYITGKLFKGPNRRKLGEWKGSLGRNVVLKMHLSPWRKEHIRRKSYAGTESLSFESLL